MTTDRETDRFETSAGEVEIMFLGHGSLLFTFGGKRLYVDPFSRVADFETLPRANAVLITHEHRDHLDEEALEHITDDATQIVCTKRCAEKLGRGLVMENGESRQVLGLPVTAVPAYNVEHCRETGDPFHPRGHGNGYVLAFGDLTVYVAGDTENVQEVKELEGIDIAFLPMNLPYTMTPEMVADVAVAIAPAVLYPYHYGSTDVSELAKLLADRKDIDVRIRSLA